MTSKSSAGNNATTDIVSLSTSPWRPIPEEITPKNSEEMSTHFVGSIALAFSTVGIVSLIGNALLVYTFCRLQRLRKEPANKFNIHLAINNGFLGSMALRYGVKMFCHLGAEDIVSCQTEGFLLSAVHMNVMLTIAAIFGERYIVVCRSSTRGSCLSSCHYHPSRVIVLIWIHSLFWAFWPLTAVVPDYRVETLIPCCIFDRHTPSRMNILYLSAMSLSAFILPLMLICFVMTRIFGEVAKSSETLRLRRGRRYVTQTRSVCSGTDGSFGEETEAKPEADSNRIKQGVIISTTGGRSGNSRTTRVMASEVSKTGSQASRRSVKPYLPERAVLRSAVVLVTTFSVSWTPFLLVCLVNLAGVFIAPQIVVVSYLLSKASCVHSSYAYATNRHFIATINNLACRN